MENNVDIVLACRDIEHQTYYKVFIEGYFDTNVYPVKDINEIAQLLERNISPTLFVGVGTPFTLNEEIKRIRFKTPSIPVLLLADNYGQNEFSSSNTTVINPTQSPWLILETISSLLKFKDRSHLEKVVSVNNEETQDDFCKIDVALFCRINRAYKDVYIRLSDRKFVKVLNSGDRYPASDMNRYQEKGVTHLYLKRDDFIDFLKLVSKTLPSLHETAATYHQLIHETVNKIGLNEMAIEVANQTITETLSFIDQNHDLKKIWGDVVRNNNYISEHSVILSYVASALLNGSRLSDYDTKIKLCLAALFHDITLSDAKHAMITGPEDVRFNSLAGRKEEQIILTHPFKAVELLSKINGIPSDVEKVILQHHERYDGAGFPKQLDFGSIAPLTVFFIIAHELVAALYDNGFSIDILRAEKVRMKEQYTKGFFAEVVELIDPILI